MSNSRSKFHRRSIRLKGYDYSQAGLYFITLCCENRLSRFGVVKNGEMILNDYGRIANDEWIKLSERFPNFELDVFQIMPNHMHAIILLTDHTVREGFTPSPNDERETETGRKLATARERATARVAPTTNSARVNGMENGTENENETVEWSTARVAPTVNPSVSDIVGAYKSLVANGCLGIYKDKNETMGKLWQRNYYEHIIRNEKAYQNISNYIVNNPAKWNEDTFY